MINRGQHRCGPSSHAETNTDLQSSEFLRDVLLLSLILQWSHWIWICSLGTEMVLSKTATRLIWKTISGPYGKVSKHRKVHWLVYFKRYFNNGENKRIVCCIKAKWFLLGPVNNGRVMVFQREHCHFNSALE